MSTLSSLLSLLAAAMIGGALLYMLAVALANHRTFPRLAPPLATPAQSLPFVSILIPARDEAALIGATVARHSAQTYGGPLEILVLDDNSSDGTASLALAAAGGDPRVRILNGAPLPPGWAGKNWACHQLAQAARGDLLLFTDADVCWEPQGLAAGVHEFVRSGAGLLAVWPTQLLGSWSERLVVPLISFSVLAYLPVQWVHRLPHSSAAAANGQCLLFARDTYFACGGHASIRASVLDDVRLARRVKAAGHALRMADAAGLIRTRMYTGWRQVRDGFAKNILAGFGDSVALLLLSTLFHLGVFVLPWLWLLTGRGPAWPVLPASLACAGIVARAITARTARRPLADALLMPFSVLLMTRIALQGIWWRYRHGGPLWRGRVIREKADMTETAE